jgi:hypothetical protein
VVELVVVVELDEEPDWYVEVVEEVYPPVIEVLLPEVLF